MTWHEEQARQQCSDLNDPLPIRVPVLTLMKITQKQAARREFEERLTLDLESKCALVAETWVDCEFACTVRGYLRGLLRALVVQGEGFNGKRPFGNSGWKYQLAAAMIREGVVEGSLDDEGYVTHCDQDEVDRILLALVEKNVI